jgi:hypothetical protein
MLFKATVNASKVAGSESNFPALVNLANMPPAFWATVANGGGDIRVYADQAKTTELAREVVACDTGTDTGEIYTKITSLTTTTEIYIDVDGIRSDYATTDTYGRNAVWSDYRLVTHGKTVDSSGNCTITKNGNFAETTSNTKVGADAYNNPTPSSTSYISIGSVSGRSLSLFARRTTSSRNGYVFDIRTGLTNGFFYLNDADLKLEFGGGFTNVYKDGAAATSGTTTFTNNTYHHYGCRTTGTWTDDITIGGRYTGMLAQDSHYGQFDEIRITKTLDLSANWYATENNNLSDNANFWSSITEVVAGQKSNFLMYM